MVHADEVKLVVATSGPDGDRKRLVGLKCSRQKVDGVGFGPVSAEA
jgi:hypothetical protein